MSDPQPSPVRFFLPAGPTALQTRPHCCPTRQLESLPSSGVAGVPKGWALCPGRGEGNLPRSVSLCGVASVSPSLADIPDGVFLVLLVQVCPPSLSHLPPGPSRKSLCPDRPLDQSSARDLHPGLVPRPVMTCGASTPETHACTELLHTQRHPHHRPLPSAPAPARGLTMEASVLSLTAGPFPFLTLTTPK